MIYFMRQMIYNPKLLGGRMTIVCFISGSGTNYQKIVQRDPNHDYVVFTNRPGCEGVEKANANNHVTIELSHIPYLKPARIKYGAMNTPRNCPERVKYEQDVCRLIEDKIGKAPDLICLAGYDQWLTDWTVDRYYPKLLNIHPGDTTKGYSGLHWIPTAKAILSGDKEIRTTLFLVDRGEDTGPILAQSKPLKITPTLRKLESEGIKGLAEGFARVTGFAEKHAITSYDDFENLADAEQKAIMKTLCENLQGALKIAGDWEVYPFAVHSLIARVCVEVLDRTVYINGRQMPVYGYRMDQELPEC
jgi:folate-dependent phosphoribosylglycinamide formyltransferase PurN